MLKTWSENRLADLADVVIGLGGDGLALRASIRSRVDARRCPSAEGTSQEGVPLRHSENGVVPTGTAGTRCEGPRRVSRRIRHQSGAKDS